MKELIIKVDDPGERVWDGSPKTFEIQELIRCKNCRYYTEPDSHGDLCDKIHWSRGDDWFCADGKRRADE